MPRSSSMVHVCDLAQNRSEAGEGASARHVRACVRVEKHRFEGVGMPANSDGSPWIKLKKSWVETPNRAVYALRCAISMVGTEAPSHERSPQRPSSLPG